MEQTIFHTTNGNRYLVNMIMPIPGRSTTIYCYGIIQKHIYAPIRWHCI